MALAGEILDSLVKPDLKDECNNIRKVVFFATKKQGERTLSLSKTKFQAKRTLTSRSSWQDYVTKNNKEVTYKVTK